MATTDFSKKRPKFLPMPGRLAVEPIEEDRYGSLYLPANRQERATIGVIVALPPLKPSAAPGFYDLQHDESLHLGDVVLFGANSGMAVEVGLGSNRKKAIFLRESEIISKVEWEEATTPGIGPIHCPTCFAQSFPSEGCPECGERGWIP